MPRAPMLPSRIDSGVLNAATAATSPVTAPAEKIGPTPSACPPAWIVVSFLGPSEPSPSAATPWPTWSAITLSPQRSHRCSAPQFCIHYALCQERRGPPPLAGTLVRRAAKQRTDGASNRGLPAGALVQADRMAGRDGGVGDQATEHA